MDNKFEREIGGVKFTTFRLPAETAWLLKLKLMKIFGPALQGLLSLGKDAQGNEEKVLSSVGEFLGTIDPEGMVKLLKEVCSYAYGPGGKITSESFNEVFADSYQDAIKVAWFVVEVNYKDFFQGASQSPLAQRVKGLTLTP